MKEVTSEKRSQSGLGDAKEDPTRTNQENRLSYCCNEEMPGIFYKQL